MVDKINPTDIYRNVSTTECKFLEHLPNRPYAEK